MASTTGKEGNSERYSGAIDALLSAPFEEDPPKPSPKKVRKAPPPRPKSKKPPGHKTPPRSSSPEREVTASFRQTGAEKPSAERDFGKPLEKEVVALPRGRPDAGAPAAEVMSIRRAGPAAGHSPASGSPKSSAQTLSGASHVVPSASSNPLVKALAVLRSDLAKVTAELAELSSATRHSSRTVFELFDSRLTALEQLTADAPARTRRALEESTGAISSKTAEESERLRQTLEETKLALSEMLDAATSRLGERLGRTVQNSNVTAAATAAAAAGELQTTVQSLSAALEARMKSLEEALGSPPEVQLKLEGQSQLLAELLESSERFQNEMMTLVNSRVAALKDAVAKPDPEVQRAAQGVTEAVLKRLSQDSQSTNAAREASNSVLVEKLVQVEELIKAGHRTTRSLGEVFDEKVTAIAVAVQDSAEVMMEATLQHADTLKETLKDSTAGLEQTLWDEAQKLNRSGRESARALETRIREEADRLDRTLQGCLQESAGAVEERVVREVDRLLERLTAAFSQIVGQEIDQKSRESATLLGAKITQESVRLQKNFYEKIQGSSGALDDHVVKEADRLRLALEEHMDQSAEKLGQKVLAQTDAVNRSLQNSAHTIGEIVSHEVKRLEGQILGSASALADKMGHETAKGQRSLEEWGQALAARLAHETQGLGGMLHETAAGLGESNAGYVGRVEAFLESMGSYLEQRFAFLEASLKADVARAEETITQTVDEGADLMREVASSLEDSVAELSRASGDADRHVTESALRLKHMHQSLVAYLAERDQRLEQLRNQGLATILDVMSQGLKRKTRSKLGMALGHSGGAAGIVEPQQSLNQFAARDRPSNEGAGSLKGLWSPSDADNYDPVPDVRDENGSSLAPVAGEEKEPMVAERSPKPTYRGSGEVELPAQIADPEPHEDAGQLDPKPSIEEGRSPGRASKETDRSAPKAKTGTAKPRQTTKQTKASRAGSPERPKPKTKSLNGKKHSKSNGAPESRSGAKKAPAKNTGAARRTPQSKKA